MSTQTESMARLQRLAQLKSDLEMRRFSAYRLHVAAAKARIATIEQDLQAIYHSNAAFSIEEARLANVLAGEKSRALLRAEVDLRQMLPGFELARAAAVREFGRAQVLQSLRNDMAEDEKQHASKKTGLL